MKGVLGLMRYRRVQMAIGAAAILVAAGLAMPALSAAATPQPVDGGPTVTVYGVAPLSVSAGAVSDANVNVNLNYNTTQSSPKTALQMAQSAMAKIKAAVQGAGGQVVGQNLNIFEQGGPPPVMKPGLKVKAPQGPPQYRADEGLNVQVSSSAQLASVITAAVNAGATGFNTYSQGSSLTPTGAGKADAIAKAYQDAQSEALALAQAEGGHLGGMEQATVEQIGPNVGPGTFVTVKVTYGLQ